MKSKIIYNSKNINFDFQINKIFKSYCNVISSLKKYNSSNFSKFKAIGLSKIFFLCWIILKFIKKNKNSFEKKNSCLVSFNRKDNFKYFLKYRNPTIVKTYSFLKIAILFQNYKFSHFFNLFNSIKSDSIAIKLLFVFEYIIALEIINNYKLIYLFGHYERILICISEIKKIYKKNNKLIVIQHGVIRNFFLKEKILIDKIYLRYLFSKDLYLNIYSINKKNFSKRFIKHDHHTEVLDIIPNNFNFCFISQPHSFITSLKYLLIIKFILKHNTTIKFHPRDSILKKIIFKLFFIESANSKNMTLITEYSSFIFDLHENFYQAIFFGHQIKYFDFYKILNKNYGKYIYIQNEWKGLIKYLSQRSK